MPKAKAEPSFSSLALLRQSFREAVPSAVCTYDYLDELDRRLVAAGWPKTSDWWRQTLSRFYRSTCPQLVLRVGRRGGKSSTLCRIAVLEALMGEHHVAPGDTGVVAIVSVSKPEAKERLETIEKILHVLGVDHKALAERIDLLDESIAFRVFAATVGGVSGFSGICILCDEVSKWLDKDAGSNPATEVLASVRPTMAGLPNAKIFLSSSPMTPHDAHAHAFDVGNTALQQVAFAETWIARPTLTEEETRRLESDHRRWLREYAAIPMDGDDDSFFKPDLLSWCTRSEEYLPRAPGVEYTAAMSPMMAHGIWSVVVAGKLSDGRGGASIVDCGEWSGGELSVAQTLEDIKRGIAYYGLTSVDSHPLGIAYADAAEKIGLHVRIVEAPIDELANEMLASLSSGEAELHPCPELRSDLLALRKGTTADGFSIRLADVERYPSYAWPAMLAIRECGRLPAPKATKTETFGTKVMRELVRRNRAEYDRGDEA
jgi:hypothetical protein